jgi:hypothetical protein
MYMYMYIYIYIYIYIYLYIYIYIYTPHKHPTHSLSTLLQENTFYSKRTHSIVVISQKSAVPCVRREHIL